MYCSLLILYLYRFSVNKVVHKLAVDQFIRQVLLHTRLLFSSADMRNWRGDLGQRRLRSSVGSEVGEGHHRRPDVPPPVDPDRCRISPVLHWLQCGSASSSTSPTCSGHFVKQEQWERW